MTELLGKFEGTSTEQDPVQVTFDYDSEDTIEISFRGTLVQVSGERTIVRIMLDADQIAAFAMQSVEQLDGDDNPIPTVHYFDQKFLYTLRGTGTFHLEPEIENGEWGNDLLLLAVVL